MIWDLINSVAGLVLHVRLAAMHGFPSSPFFLTSGQLSDIAGVSGYVTWFLPVTAMLTFLGTVLVAIAVILTIQLVQRIWRILSLFG